jgi:hypothetical protein
MDNLLFCFQVPDKILSVFAARVNGKDRICRAHIPYILTRRAIVDKITYDQDLASGCSGISALRFSKKRNNREVVIF